MREEILGLERQLGDAIEAGVDLIQVRERDLEAGVLRALTARVACRASAGTRVIVNDRADVARAAGAAGVHLRADGPPIARVRPLGPAAWLVGRSVHSTGDVRASGDSDYLLFGSVFASRSKLPGAPVAGVEALRAAAEASPVPVLAIGGITPGRVIECRQAGAVGVAAIGVFLPPGRTPDALGAVEAVRALRRAWLEDRQT